MHLLFPVVRVSIACTNWVMTAETVYVGLCTAQSASEPTVVLGCIELLLFYMQTAFLMLVLSSQRFARLISGHDCCCGRGSCTASRYMKVQVLVVFPMTAVLVSGSAAVLGYYECTQT